MEVWGKLWCCEVFAVFVTSTFLCVSASNVELDEGIVPGRIVSLAGKTYRQAFKTSLQLGQCPLAFNDSNIELCSSHFAGETVFIPRGLTKVSISQVESSEDILTHVMGSVATSVGVLGLASVNPKYKVAVTTETSNNNLNLLSNYYINQGVLVLKNPQPTNKTKGEKSLFLSEIELGGDELLLVTVQFDSEKLKVDAEASVVVTVLFVSIYAKLQYIYETLDTKASVRIQFQSSWRTNLDETFSHLEEALFRVSEVESMFMQGPLELASLSHDDERLHNVYHFSSWGRSPYGDDYNEAVIRSDQEFLSEQNVEVRSTIRKINELNKQVIEPEMRQKMKELNETLSEIAEKLQNGLNSYHLLADEDRTELRDIYGPDKAPFYYSRKLNEIIS